ncbi:hypothetical protein NDU88_006277 [Pleurodeles waltl]|uniref:Uncharacterized protein n=1 Tax=Pleurodeles waltl TaxID=8319 RepID=A0AAV7VMB8_PLEWA|nr:hypothetical protein NDU88_006277 [Pleurodeles waltl]
MQEAESSNRARQCSGARSSPHGQDPLGQTGADRGSQPVEDSGSRGEGQWLLSGPNGAGGAAGLRSEEGSGPGMEQTGLEEILGCRCGPVTENGSSEYGLRSMQGKP